MATPPKSAAPPSGSPSDAMLPAQLAKAALRRLVLEKLEPTPENYERAYQQEAGVLAPRAASDAGGEQLAELIDRIVRGIEQRSRQWTTARKKDSLQRVLVGSRGECADASGQAAVMVPAAEEDLNEWHAALGKAAS